MKGKVRKTIIGSFIGVIILAVGIKTNHEMRLIFESGEVQTAIKGSQMVNMKNGRIHAVIKETSEAEDTIFFCRD